MLPFELHAPALQPSVDMPGKRGGMTTALVVSPDSRRTPTTCVLSGMYSVRYPCMPLIFLSGTGVYLNRNWMMSPGASLTSPEAPPDDEPVSGSITATVVGGIDFDVMICATPSPRATAGKQQRRAKAR